MKKNLLLCCIIFFLSCKEYDKKGITLLITHHYSYSTSLQPYCIDCRESIWHYITVYNNTLYDIPVCCFDAKYKVGETEVQDLWHEPGSISFPRKFTKTRGSLCEDKEYIKSHSEGKIELVNSHFNKQLTVERYQYILNHGKLTVSFDSTCLFEQNPEHAADILKIPVKVRTSFFCKYELR